MTRLSYAESHSHDPYFNLSFEKYLFENVPDDEVIFYLWQNERTVVCGRNQNIYKECNLAALDKLGGKVARRLSGGGAVFHDLGNLNFSFIARDALYDVDRQMEIIRDALSRMGFNVERSGRNDLTIDGRKFSGNAFHRANGSNCHHGTIMIDVDPDIIKEVLTVDPGKLESKGVSSVISRVANLKDFKEDITIDELKKNLFAACLREYDCKNFSSEITIESNMVISSNGRLDWFSDGSMLTMLQSLSENRTFFADDKWIYGRNPAFTNITEHRFDWGSVEICLNVEGDEIKDCKIFSDSLVPEFILAAEDSLHGTKYSPDKIKAAIDKAAAGVDDDVASISEDIKSLF
ncbi:MAG: lipoate--protein ligase [Clostridia bacterium]|nr:lipoate--protein ligase [Clostridia bacterium]MBQ3896986.1 lipoate--protein ligase [Clostridia bacterium]